MSTKICNLCGSNTFEHLNIDEPVTRTGHNVLCSTCGLIFHYPAMTVEEMSDFYASEYSDEYSASETISRDLAKERIEILKTKIDLPNAAPVLEVGCAQGEFLAEISSLGIMAQGVEPSRSMAEQGQDYYGLDITTGVYDDLPEQPKKYGLICMFHVLEHVADPLATLKRIRREIKTDGHLFLEVPTLGDCQLALVFKKIHPTTFVRETLEAMLALAGFSPTMVEERGYHLRMLVKPTEPRNQVPMPDALKIRGRVFDYLTKRRDIIGNIKVTLNKFVGKPGGAIYGAGLNTLDLNQVFPLSQLQLERAFDSDPRKQGRKILGLTIYPPDNLHNWHGQYLIISSYAFQEEICRQLHYLEERGIELVILYNKETG